MFLFRITLLVLLAASLGLQGAVVIQQHNSPDGYKFFESENYVDLEAQSVLFKDTLEPVPSKFYTLMRDAEPGSVVTINLDCKGSFAFTAFRVVDAIIQSKATIRVNILGDASSGCSMVALTADEMSVSRRAYMLFHEVQIVGASGSASDVIASVYRTNMQFKLLTSILGEGFLSTEEIDSLFSGNARSMMSNEIKERAKRAGIKVVDEESRTTEASQSD